MVTDVPPCVTMEGGGWSQKDGPREQRVGFLAPPPASRSGEDRPSNKAFRKLPLGSEGCSVLTSLMSWGVAAPGGRGARRPQPCSLPLPLCHPAVPGLHPV